MCAKLLYVHTNLYIHSHTYIYILYTHQHTYIHVHTHIYICRWANDSKNIKTSPYIKNSLYNCNKENNE